MKIIFKSKKGHFNAIAEYNNSVKVLKGSIISDRKYDCNISPIAKNCRENSEYVNDYIVIKDVSFNSLSMAAQFVSGYKANGFRVWKTETGEKIKR